MQPYAEQPESMRALHLNFPSRIQGRNKHLLLNCWSGDR